MKTLIGVELRDTQTGLHLCYLDTYATEHLDGVEFMYSDGNYGCDCNRALFLARAQGLTNPDRPCGWQGIICAGVFERPSGRVLYSGDESGTLA